MATTAERLVERLRTDPATASLTPVVSVAKRLGHSTAQRKNGAWSWHLVDDRDFTLDIGSQYTMTQCLKAPVLVVGRDKFGSISIYPQEG